MIASQRVAILLQRQSRIRCSQYSICGTVFPGNRLGRQLKSSRLLSSSASEETKKPINDVRGALFPNPIPNPKGKEGDEEQLEFPTSIKGWRRVLNQAWRDYRSTWEGFFDGSTAENENESSKKGENETNPLSDMEKIIETQKLTIQGNVERNVEFVKTEAPKLFRFVQDETKIYTKEDLKQWAGEQLKLASACVKEFLTGYRSGRDGELDKMLNTYFKEIDSKADNNNVSKPRRRKPKRLVRKTR